MTHKNKRKRAPSMRLRDFRAFMGWTQQRLAQEIGVSRPMIAHAEKGTKRFGLRSALALESASMRWDGGPIRASEWAL